MNTPSYKEDHISQIPALQLLMKMGYKYLSPEEALEARSGRTSNVLLEGVLKQQLAAINHIEYKGKEFSFSDANINAAVLALRDLPAQDGFMKANEAFYDLITLGKSFEQTVLNDKKSFSFRYIDWQHPENNVYHVTEEFAVLREGRNDHYRPDIVLFVNGIPMVVIECKSPRIKEPVDKAIEQHLRNQQDDGIRSLYNYSNLVMALSSDEAMYATTATTKEFWGKWKEVFRNETEQKAYNNALQELKNRALPQDERTVLFRERFRNVLQYFDKLEAGEQIVTTQDKILYSLCRPERLLRLTHDYTLYDEGVKKVARYQQYFAVEETVKKITKTGVGGKRTGGVIWHTQGSGKSLTMVMLAQQIAVKVKNPKIILVTDRIDLDSQITGTFKKCGKSVVNASTGRNLAELIESDSDGVITTIINKFESAINQAPKGFESPDIFVLVDEGHRSQYGSFNVKMQRIFPNACFIAFTGTPLMKSEKNTAIKFGGMIDVYSITDAVSDKAVVPLLYEGRHNQIDVNARPLDTFFEQVSEPLTDYGKGQLKKKFSRIDTINKADQVIYERAIDIVKHYCDNFQMGNPDYPQKAMLVAPNKYSAIKYREYIQEFGKSNQKYNVHCEVIISAPDMREGEEDTFEKADDKVKAFWNAMMDRFNNKEKDYNDTIIKTFKKQEYPELLIVVDKLLTGFDAPCATVLYLTRPLKEHTLLQAIARVNRLYPGKDYGYIIDYYGNLQNLDNALNTYSGLEDFDEEELHGTLTNISKEVEKLPQVHSELWDVFKSIKNKYDAAAYKEFLFDDAARYQFYDKLSVYGRLLKLAYTSVEFDKNTPEKQKKKYRDDFKFFLELREIVKYSYSDDLKYEEYEPQVQKLIDKHITTEGEVLRLTSLVDIFNKESREEEIEKLVGKATKADHIATKTIRAINVKMNEDPVYYKRLSQLIRETINAYHAGRISEIEYLNKTKEHEDQFKNKKQSGVPDELTGNEVAVAFYNQAATLFEDEVQKEGQYKQFYTDIALGVESAVKSIIYENEIIIVDWQNNSDLEGKLRIVIDDFVFEIKSKYDISLPFNKIDELIEECIKIAKVRYK